MSPELTALVVIVTLILQTWYQRWVTKGDKKEVVQKVETVHKAVNGEGIGGKLDTPAPVAGGPRTVGHRAVPRAERADGRDGRPARQAK
jgi:hypothetical protein